MSVDAETWASKTGPSTNLRPTQKPLAPVQLDLRSDRDVPWPVVRVTELWRYPVKSLQGERLDVVSVGSDGLEGDRRFSIYDLATGFGLTARRVPELLFASARLLDDDGVEITLPDGSLARDDEALSNWLGRRVELGTLGSFLCRCATDPQLVRDHCEGQTCGQVPEDQCSCLAPARGRGSQASTGLTLLRSEPKASKNRASVRSECVAVEPYVRSGTNSNGGELALVSSTDSRARRSRR